MNVLAHSIENLHERVVCPRRVRVLARHLADMLPAPCRSALDVGCGDGAVARRLASERPGLDVAGVEVRPRAGTAIDVTPFDGRRIPLEADSRDAVLLVDVLHHAGDPVALLRDAARVARHAVLVKDHLRTGPLAGPTLRFMDHVGNRRFDVAVTGRYWSRREWAAALAAAGLRVDAWRGRLGLYPWPLRVPFERDLHFVARLVPAAAESSGARAPAADTPDVDAWEAAYRRFETPEEETAKFLRRLRWAHAADWPRDARIAELFCGRGGGLAALACLGFRDLEGIDRSAALLASYDGPARCTVADCRALPCPDASKDVVVVHGGLHHLERLPEDLERGLDEIHRVLSPQGEVLLVEPWMTPMLALVHRACGVRGLRRVWTRLDALATMIEHERETYERWLERPGAIRAALERRFEPVRVRTASGKLMFRGRRRPAGEARS